MAGKAAIAGNTTSRAEAAGGVSTPRQGGNTGIRQSSYFASEPIQRPSYIPWGLSMAHGYYAPIYYDTGYHSYGYWDDIGRWVLWNSMMNQHRAYYSNGWVDNGYRPQPPPILEDPSPTRMNPVSYTPQPQRVDSGFYSSQPRRIFPFLLLLPLLFAIGLVVAGILFIRRQSDTRARAGVESSFDSPPPIPRLAANVRTTQASGPDTAVMNTLSPGATIILTDPQSLEDSRKRGLGSNGIHFTVERTIIATDRGNIGKWIFYWINDQVQPLLLMAKVCDGATDWFLYYRNMDFATARREEVVARGDKWLFEPPADENNFVPADLMYTAEIDYKIDGREIRFVRKAQGERQASAGNGTGNLLATIVEYSSAGDVENPELLVLELGPAGAVSGEITLYSGCPINPSDIHLMQA